MSVRQDIKESLLLSKKKPGLTEHDLYNANAVLISSQNVFDWLESFITIILDSKLIEERIQFTFNFFFLWFFSVKKRPSNFTFDLRLQIFHKSSLHSKSLQTKRKKRHNLAVNKTENKFAYSSLLINS